MSKLAAISSSRSVSGIRRVGSDDADLLGLKDRGPCRCGCAPQRPQSNASNMSLASVIPRWR